MATEILCGPTGVRQIKAVHASATVAHEPVLLASGILGVPVVAEDAAAENVFNVEVESLRVDKATGGAWIGGQKIYWNNTAKNFTHVSTSNTLVGMAVAPAASDDTTGIIYLNPNVNA